MKPTLKYLKQFNQIGTLPGESLWDKEPADNTEYYPSGGGPRLPKFTTRAKRYLSRRGMD